MDNHLTNVIPNDLISIGEFAKQTQLSIKALRLYHDKGLLEPAYIDPFTNYRYYASTQVDIANYIRLLREMDIQSDIQAEDHSSKSDSPNLANNVVRI